MGAGKDPGSLRLIFPITGRLLKTSSSGGVLQLDIANRRMVSDPHMVLSNRSGLPKPSCFLFIRRPHALTPLHQDMGPFHLPLVTEKEAKFCSQRARFSWFKSQLCHFPGVRPEASFGAYL